MKEKKSQIVSITILIALIILLGFLLYVLYQYLPGKPEHFAAVEKPKLETGNLSYEFKQFYPNMKFNHNDISYSIDPDCEEEKQERMITAFNELAIRVGVISFHESIEPDIQISCSEQTESLIERGGRDFFIAGEGGAKGVIQTGRYNVITEGVVLLYKDVPGTKCDWPNLEIHELLHVFGFEHSKNESSLMYPYLESCNQKLDEAIIQHLKELYSKKNLPDLYFEEIQATKRGRYLDFNVTVKNSGVIDAESVLLAVFEDKEEIEGFNLQKVIFGGGVTFQVSNLRLRSRGSDTVEIVLDPFDLVREIDEDNNVAELSFQLQ